MYLFAYREQRLLNHLHSIQNVPSKEHELTRNENAHLAYKYIFPWQAVSISLTMYNGRSSKSNSWDCTNQTMHPHHTYCVKNRQTQHDAHFSKKKHCKPRMCVNASDAEIKRRCRTVLISQSLFDFTNKPEECASLKYHRGLSLKHIWSVLDARSAACTWCDASPRGTERMVNSAWQVGENQDVSLRKHLERCGGFISERSFFTGHWKRPSLVGRWSRIGLFCGWMTLKMLQTWRVPSLARTWSVKQECPWSAGVRSNSRNLLIWNTQEDKHVKLSSKHHCWSTLSASSTLTDSNAIHTRWH